VANEHEKIIADRDLSGSV